MNRFKKIVALLTITATLSTSASVFSADCNDCGYAYEGTRRASSISPLLALGTVGLVAGIVVAINESHGNKSKNSGSGSGSSTGTSTHSHSHSH